MKRTSFSSTLLSSALLVVGLVALGGLPACTAESGDASDGAESTEQDITGAPAGYWRLATAGQQFGMDRWIEEVNLHVDGTYEANFGNDVSNLSGHHYRMTGTYHVEKKSGESRMVFDGDPYVFRMNDGALELRFVGIGWTNQPWFAMKKQAAPIAITFAADGSATANGPLVAGGTALVRYAASRAHCGREGLAGFSSSDLGQRGWMDFGLGGAVKGMYSTLFTVPAGHDLAIWFHDTSSGCDQWDSNNSHNFHFAIASGH